MRKQLTGAALVIALCSAAMLAIVGEATAADPHAGLTWQGSQTCLTCHETEAREIHGSSHYQWRGPTPYTVNGPETQGKLDTALNSYCISIMGNWNACGTCHVGLGAKPEPAVTVAQLRNVDCLICHQKEYKRKKVDGVFVPDTANMTVTMDQAVAAVHTPERSNCLQCHAKGGGGDNNKRGDMAIAQGTTADRSFDVHMATTGANLSCQQCHTTENHRIAGRGSDLRQTDLDVKMNCSTTSCHPGKATSKGHGNENIGRHVNRVACQTCHIPTYARNAADTTATETTEVYRDWLVPEWHAALGRWEPTITRGGNLKPVYAFWNGFSWNYSLKDTVWLDAASAAYGTSRPEGGINDPASKLYPFKYKKSRQPLAGGPGVLIALDTAVYFSTGNYDAAVRAGLVNMGYPDTTPYSDVETDTYQLITHEVMPKGNALTCNQCHTATATQMNLKGMGYAMRGTQETTCTQCHEREEMPSYTKLHDKHVKDKKYDCSWCHGFSRPERGLKMPPGTTSPAAPDIAAAGSLDFGRVKVQDSVRKSMVVTNRGTATLTVTKVEAVGTDAAAFKPRTGSFAVNSSGGYELQVEFRPTARRSYTAALRIHSNDPDTPIKQIVLSGTGRR